jgi:hypothetical protein
MHQMHHSAIVQTERERERRERERERERGEREKKRERKRERERERETVLSRTESIYSGMHKRKVVRLFLS